MKALRTVQEHARIIWALMLRELATRYGRNNIGFLWVIGEPLVFAIGVLILWRAIKGPFESGFGVVPFTMCGYMPTILVRHMVMYSLNSTKINAGLLYHRQISILDLFFARIILEFIAVSIGFVMLVAALLPFGLVPFPADLMLVYEGWMITALTGWGLALITGAVSEMFEVVERVVGVTLYLLVPVSGTFFLASWLPPEARQAALLLPFLHCSEMIRAGFFGASVSPIYDAGYATLFGAVMLVIGLLLMRHVRERVEIY
jgi:capsular polysaccharide transport system permease protein